MKSTIKIPDGWGYREIGLMADVLKAYVNNPRGIEKPVKVMFDDQTGSVHLIDATKTEYTIIRSNPEDLVKSEMLE